MSVVAQSSNGRVWFCPETGNVLAYQEDPDCEGTLSFIVRIDVERLRSVYPDGIPSDVDILECGYWTNEGDYEPPLRWDGNDFVEADIELRP